MIKSGQVENRQTTQVLASFCFFHQNILFFSCRLFSINLKLLSEVFLISDQFSLITGCYFHHRYFHCFLLDFLSRGTRSSQESMGRGRPFLTPQCHFHLFHEHLCIGQAITAENPPLNKARGQTQTGNLWFQVANN